MGSLRPRCVHRMPCSLAESEMYSHATHRGFECWVLREDDIDSISKVLGAVEEASELKITFMCKNSVRAYESLVECKSDENNNEDPIECVVVEVSIPEKGKRKLALHHVGTKPASATIVAEVTDKGPDALRTRDEILRGVRRLKPWWSWIAESEAEKALLSLVAMIVACATTLLVNGHINMKTYGMATDAFWLAGAFLLFAVLYAVAGLFGVRTLATRARMAIFPQGVVAIGEGKDRLEQVFRRQKAVGFFGNVGIAVAIAVTIALAV